MSAQPRNNVTGTILGKALGEFEHVADYPASEGVDRICAAFNAQPWSVLELEQLGKGGPSSPILYPSIGDEQSETDFVANIKGMNIMSFQGRDIVVYRGHTHRKHRICTWRGNESIIEYRHYITQGWAILPSIMPVETIGCDDTLMGRLAGDIRRNAPPLHVAKDAVTGYFSSGNGYEVLCNRHDLEPVQEPASGSTPAVTASINALVHQVQAHMTQRGMALYPYQLDVAAWLLRADTRSVVSRLVTPASVHTTDRTVWPYRYALGHSFFLATKPTCRAAMFGCALPRCGGVLALGTGLGKTVLMCALIAAGAAPCTPLGTRMSPNPGDWASTWPGGVGTVRTDEYRRKALVAQVGDIHHRVPLLVQGGTLLIVPRNLIDQWRAALTNILGEGTVVVFGAGRGAVPVARRTAARAARSLCVLTTDAVVSKAGPQGGATGGAIPAWLQHVYWNRVIVDERRSGMPGGQAKLKSVLTYIKIRSLWLLSATPLGNGRDRDATSAENVLDKLFIPAVRCGNMTAHLHQNHFNVLCQAVLARTRAQVEASGRGAALPPMTTRVHWLPRARESGGTPHDRALVRGMRRLAASVRASDVIPSYRAVMSLHALPSHGQPLLASSDDTPVSAASEDDDEATLQAETAPPPSPEPEPAPEPEPGTGRPIRAMTEDDAIGASTDCPICMCPMDDEEAWGRLHENAPSETMPWVTLPCKHALCVGCTSIAYTGGLLARCPMCRASLMSDAARARMEAAVLLFTGRPYVRETSRPSGERRRPAPVEELSGVTLTELREAVALGSTARARATVELLADITARGERALVLLASAAQARWLAASLDEHGVGTVYPGAMECADARGTLLATWDAARCPDTVPEHAVIVETMAAAAAGLNVTHAQHVILPFVPHGSAGITQAAGRIHRPGQRAPTQLHIIAQHDTLDGPSLFIRRMVEEVPSDMSARSTQTFDLAGRNTALSHASEKMFIVQLVSRYAALSSS